MSLTITLPLDEARTRQLQCGQQVTLTGRVLTARDWVHARLAAGAEPPCSFDDAVVYHCGPVVTGEPGNWQIIAAGPTTSAREEPHMPALIERFGIRAVIGKGGMGEATLRACANHGCVYLSAVGGAAQVLARSIVAVRNVYWLEEAGPPEAVWELDVRSFPAIVTMDSHGNSLHAQVAEDSARRVAELT